MAATGTISLFGEILPRLGCVNIVLAGECLGEVKAGADTITVGPEVFRVTGYQFEEISGLTRTERSLAFRLKILDCDKLPGLIFPISTTVAPSPVSIDCTERVQSFFPECE